MSFNPNHKKSIEITPCNYEEYFLLYIDDELTPEEKEAVEAFAVLHPDLKEELDALQETKLHAESITLPGKQLLLADEMKAGHFMEHLLLYLDDELGFDEKKKLEKELNHNTALRLQYELLLKTKLDKTETISYPDKKELYHRTEKRTPLPLYWLSIAAAVLIILFAGLFYWIVQDHMQSTQPVAVQPPPQPKVESIPSDRDSVTVIQPQKDYLAVQNKKSENNTETLRSITKKQQQVKGAPVKQKPVFTDLAQHPQKTVKELLVKERNEVHNPPATKEAVDVAINKLPVTSDTPPAYTTTEAPANPQANFAVAKDEKKGGTLKTILRKATRFIERRTGITATNEDDELLIGAVAIQL